MLEPPARAQLPDWLNSEPALPADHEFHRAIAWTGAAAEPATLSQALVEEIPVALVYNGVSHAVMFATPSELEDFAYGFSLSENIIDSGDDIYGIDIAVADLGVEIHIELASARFAGLMARRRSLAGRSGCGLCGIDSLAAAVRTPPPLAHPFRLSRAALARALVELGEEQPLHRLTGAAHAAAWVSGAGEVRLVREDVGRHNALDKLIGALLRRGNDPRDGFVLVTSRASYEMVHKTANAGIACLAAISGPSAHAVRLAEQLGLTLVGFARGQRCTSFSFPTTLSE